MLGARLLPIGNIRAVATPSPWTWCSSPWPRTLWQMTTPPATGRGRYSRADVIAHTRELLSVGFTDFADTLVRVSTEFTDLEVPPPGSPIAAIVREAWSSRVAEQRRWRDEGDYTRLASAFDTLTSRGVVARMNFTCCQTCGLAEIDDERTPVPAGGHGGQEGHGAHGGYGGFREWGFTYFHQQDAERLADGGDLFLAFGTFGPLEDSDPALLARARTGDPAARTAVMDASSVRAGAVVVDALRSAGLSVTWDGSVGRRIAVTITDWRKRLPT